MTSIYENFINALRARPNQWKCSIYVIKIYRTEMSIVKVYVGVVKKNEKFRSQRTGGLQTSVLLLQSRYSDHDEH